MSSLLRFFGTGFVFRAQMRNRWRQWATVVFWAILVAAVVGPWWNLPFPYTHDGENHLARFMNTAATMRQGQIPPRFAPDVFSGYGFPVLHYNYPLANLLAVPFVWLKLHPATIFALQSWFALTLGVSAVWYTSRRWLAREQSFLVSLFYLFSPPLISMLYWRGSVGEILAYGLVPVIVWSVIRWSSFQSLRNWWLLTLSFLAFGLAHNVLLLILGPWILMFVLWYSWKFGGLKGTIVSGLASIGMTLWFWIPALLELDLIVLASDSLASQAMDHTLTWWQIWFSPVGFGFSFPGIQDSLGFGLGVPAILVLVLSTAFLLASAWKTSFRYRSAWLIFGVLLAVSLFFSWDGSALFWEKLPFLALIQFPWRWMALSSLVLLPILGLLLLSLPRWSWVYCVLLVSLLFQANWLLARPLADRVGHDAMYYRLFPYTTTTRNENRPRTFTAEVLPDWQPAPSVLSGQAEISVQRWNGSSREYTVLVSEPTVIVEPTVFFPGWKTTVNGEKTSYDLEVAQGRIAYELSAQDDPQTVKSVFSERTVIRGVSEILSLGVFGVVISGTLWKWRKQS